ncbi:RebB family R body protein [Pseudomonas sp. CGJS7]|uniref:RebB family R body protein n=1 Tax=Pseudomonas sp. CGJS7 TaxID=3109348 RepID=UPI00300A79F4
MDEATSASTSVNPQITDAVTQTNVKVTAQAPATAIAQLYQTVAHATGLMAENAANSQQQQSMINSSAAAQATIVLLDQTGNTPGDGPTPPVGAGPGVSTGLSEPADLEAHVQDSAQRLKQLASDRGAVNSQIVSAIETNHHYSLGAAGVFAYAQREVMQAFVDGLEQINAAQYRQQLQAVQITATAVCLSAMLKSPERAEEYAAVLQAIKQLE